MYEDCHNQDIVTAQNDLITLEGGHFKWRHALAVVYKVDLYLEYYSELFSLRLLLTLDL